MRMPNISKSQFPGLNEKIFYFYDGIVYMPLSHPLLEMLRKEKKGRNTYFFAHKGKEKKIFKSRSRSCLAL